MSINCLAGGVTRYLLRGVGVLLLAAYRRPSMQGADSVASGVGGHEVAALAIRRVWRKRLILLRGTDVCYQRHARLGINAMR